VRLQQHRNIEVSGATLECTLYGSGTPVVLLANAGCSSGYFDDLARVLATGGLQALCINMRETGESRGSLDGITVHDLAADVAGVLEVWIAVRRTSLAMPSAIGSLAAWQSTGPRWYAT
jgi:pimeloyl-ACP methyl ester carboxylesterase